MLPGRPAALTGVALKQGLGLGRVCAATTTIVLLSRGFEPQVSRVEFGVLACRIEPGLGLQRVLGLLWGAQGSLCVCECVCAHAGRVGNKQTKTLAGLGTLGLAQLSCKRGGCIVGACQGQGTRENSKAWRHALMLHTTVGLVCAAACVGRSSCRARVSRHRDRCGVKWGVGCTAVAFAALVLCLLCVSAFSGGAYVRMSADHMPAVAWVEIRSRGSTCCCPVDSGARQGTALHALYPYPTCLLV